MCVFLLQAKDIDVDSSDDGSCDAERRAVNEGIEKGFSDKVLEVLKRTLQDCMDKQSSSEVCHELLFVLEFDHHLCQLVNFIVALSFLLTQFLVCRR